MSRQKPIYEGKAKILYKGPQSGTFIQYFKDDATAFNNKKKAVISGKGALNNRISSHLMTCLGQSGIPTHLIRRLNMREQLVKAVEIIPIEVVVRNLAAGSLCRRIGVDEGHVLPRSIVEYYYKSDELDDPMVCEEHITAMNWATSAELDDIFNLALRINDCLSGVFFNVGLKLVDFKIEFGRFWDNEHMQILLADEISPDSCRLWDMKTKKKMDKDRFRHDLGHVEEAYRDVARRLCLLPENDKSNGVITKDPSITGKSPAKKSTAKKSITGKSITGKSTARKSITGKSSAKVKDKSPPKNGPSPKNGRKTKKKIEP